MKSRFFKKLAALALAFVLLLPLLAVVGNPATAEPVSVTAEETVAETEAVEAENLSDDDFAITDGMGTNGALTTLQTEITLKNPALETWLTNDISNAAAAVFTVYRDNGDGVGNVKFRILLQAMTLVFNYGGKLLTKPVVVVYLQKVEYDDYIDFSTNDFFSIEGEEGVAFGGTQIPSLEESFLGEELTDPAYGKNPFVCIKLFSVFDDYCAGLFPYATVNGAPTFRFIFKVSSYTTNYFVGFEYGFNGSEKYTNTLTSASRSIFGILTKMQEKGELEENFTTETSLARAQSVLSQGVKQAAKIEYLEEIEGTYLAKKVSATISVPIIDGRLASDDVATALKKESMRCQNANVRRFAYDEDRGVWTAEYLSAVHLKTRTVDGGGHVLNMFLDINKSYADYYGDLGGTVTNGAGIYEFMFNKLKNAYYPKLEEVSEKDLYGYFGQVWLPSNNMFASFNATAAALFNIKTEELGFITSFEWEEDITYEEHEALMDSYNYTWLKAKWEELTDFVTGKKTTAKYYFFTAAPIEYVGISQTGDASEDDEDGALENVVRDPLGAIGDLLGDFFGLGDGVGGVVKRVSSLIVVGVVAFAIVYLVMYVKSGGLTGQGSKKKGKKKK